MGRSAIPEEPGAANRLLTNGMTTPSATPLLRMAGVWKTYPGVVALRDVRFEVAAGEVCALLGENGAGKSTLVGVASGSVVPDRGAIELAGETHPSLSPALASRLGIAIVHQEPALLPDLTVLENLELGIPAEHRTSPRLAWAREQLDRVGATVDLNARLEDVSVAERQLIEIAKALAIKPRVLILDEPTAPLGADRVTRLFELVREAARSGVAVVYISHRLPEVRAIADRVTVLRDGAVRGTFRIDEVSDAEILRLIVGREISAAFPPKLESPPAESGLVVEGLTGQAFDNVDLEVRPGEIVGLAGISGNGQTEFLRALAGLEKARGTVTLAGEPLRLGKPQAARAAGVAYISANRREEGLLSAMSVRENAALSALRRFARLGVVSRKQEVAAVEGQCKALSIATPSIETTVLSLSGGNQQKVALARALLADAKLVLADEPTQGVDAGVRVEIYRHLRDLANQGVPVLVLSSDGLELGGLCDRVAVFSRGQVVQTLEGDAVTEERIAEAIVTATAHRRDLNAETRRGARFLRLRQFLRGDYAPAAVLALIIVALGLYTYSRNELVWSQYNISTALVLLSALALMSFGQHMVVLTGGIDLSVGPLSGLIVVVSSFFVLDGKSTGMVALGFLLMLAVGLAVGVVNGGLVRFGRFTPVAATLTTFVAVQGIALWLRPFQEGSIRTDVTAAITKTVGWVPWAFIVVVVLAIVLEYLLRRSRLGMGLRAAGSREKAAYQLGVDVRWIVVGAYALAGLLVALGGVMLMAQVGVGDATAGAQYTLASITAVVLGGTSLFGGRGSFIAVLLGAFLIQQIINATTFLNLSQEWQYWFLGLITLLAAGIYSQARRVGTTV